MRSGIVLVEHDAFLTNSERFSSIAAYNLSTWTHLFELIV